MPGRGRVASEASVGGTCPASCEFLEARLLPDLRLLLAVPHGLGRRGAVVAPACAVISWRARDSYHRNRLPGAAPMQRRDHVKSRAEDHVMHLPWPARQYERTCTHCGYAWRVPRQFARKGVVPIYGATSGIRGRAGGPAAAADLQAGIVQGPVQRAGKTRLPSTAPGRYGRDPWLDCRQ